MALAIITASVLIIVSSLRFHICPHKSGVLSSLFSMLIEATSNEQGTLIAAAIKIYASVINIFKCYL